MIRGEVRTKEFDTSRLSSLESSPKSQKVKTPHLMSILKVYNVSATFLTKFRSSFILICYLISIKFHKANIGHTIIRLSESRDPKIGIQRWIRLHCYTCGAFLDVVEHCKKRRIEYGNAGCGGPEDDSYGVIPGDEGQCKNS